MLHAPVVLATWYSLPGYVVYTLITVLGYVEYTLVAWLDSILLAFLRSINT